MAESKVTLPLTGSGDATAPMLVDSITKGAITGNVQYVKVVDGTSTSGNELIVNASGEAKVNAADGSIVALGTVGSDTSASSTIYGKLLKLVSLLPTALGAGGGLKVDGSGTALPVSLAANQSVNQAQVAGTATDTNSGNKSAGTQRVVIATDQPALTNALKVDPSGVTSPVSGTVTANLGVSASSTGPTTNRQTALSNVAVAIKASAGNVFGWHVFNPNGADCYLQVYDVAQGSVTVGTTTPKLTYWVPGGGALDDPPDAGPIFSCATAITIAATTTPTGGSAPTTGLLVNTFYA